MKRLHYKVEENMDQTPKKQQENELDPQVFVDQNPFELVFLLKKGKEHKYEIAYAKGVLSGNENTLNKQ